MSLQAKRLFVAIEMSNKNWKLAFGDGRGDRERTIPARAEGILLREVAMAKEKFGLAGDAGVLFCYEAGRDGFWPSRMVQKHGYECRVMDPASIEVPRRSRHRKTDRLDAKKLLRLLQRAELWGEQDAFSVVRVPSEEQEAQLRVHRERERLVKERTGHRARIKSLLVLQGIDARNPATVVIERLRDWNGNRLHPLLQQELSREQQRLVLVEEQLHGLEKRQEQALAAPDAVGLQKAAKLHRLKALGVQSSWLLSHECFAWRSFRNRKQVGSFAGLTGTPFDSGETLREQGISKAGSARVRTTMIELAWGWLRWQPESALSKWFAEHYVRDGSKRSRRKGIVALARKLLVALWKYVEHDLVPEGAVLKV